MDNIYDNYHMRGILILNAKDNLGRPKKEPLYIAEYFGGDPTNSIALYKVKKVKMAGSDEEYYDKDFTETEINNNPYSPSTFLGKLANNSFKTKKKTVRQYKLPLFITTIEDGVDSFTGKKGPGFYEEEPGKSVLHDPTGKRYRTWEEGKRTGVFLCLSSFKWTEVPYVPKEVTRVASLRRRSEEADSNF